MSRNFIETSLRASKDVEARDCIDSQKQHLCTLEHEGEDTSRATALLGLLEETLQLMHCHRATILEKVAADKSVDFPQKHDGPCR